MKFGFKHAFLILLTSSIFACSGGGSGDPTPPPPPPPANSAPVANAGAAQSVEVGATVTLSASASSDANGDTLTYAWTLVDPNGAAATLSSATAVSPTFVAGIRGDYVASLVVNDGTVNSAGASVTITANTVPVAIVGPNRSAVTGTIVTVDGTASSDADGDAITYAWVLTRPAASAAVLDNATSPSPKFTVDVDGTYVATLTVTDGTADSESAPVTVEASSVNIAPSANAGPDQFTSVGDAVTLNGTNSSDVNGDEITYAWTLTTSPTGSTASITGPTLATASFTPLVVGEYVAQLIVNDGTLASLADTVTITVSEGNSAPVANAGPNLFFKTGTVTLNGSASTDANGDALTYSWSFVSRPTGSAASLSSNTAVSPTFSADLEGSYVLSLIVSDSVVSSASDSVLVRVADAEITFFEKEGVFGNTFNEVPFPYDEEITVNTDVVGSPPPTTVTLDAFRIVAQGGDLTIINLTAVNETTSSSLVPFFSQDLSGDLSAGFVLKDGEVAGFGLVSPLTRGERVELRFSFEIEETGQTFTSSYVLTSN